MNQSRRNLITTGLAAAAGATGLAAAGKLADQYGLLAPDSGGIYGPGEALTYASQKLLTRHSLAREFRRDQISKVPFVNGPPFQHAAFKAMEANRFADWKLSIDGMVAHPGTISLADLKRYPSRSQITNMACEEGWSYIAEWTGVPLLHVLNEVGVLPQAKYVVYFSMDKKWRGSIDMDDAVHPQTLLSYGLNGGELPVGNGGPLRLRVPRQLGYKSVKHITRITVTDDLKKFEVGGSYAWYAGI
jgi:DMSO/TMAO reductase YedYZ molybdopterin-dependent catalytic subunit